MTDRPVSVLLPRPADHPVRWTFSVEEARQVVEQLLRAADEAEDTELKSA